MMSILIIKYLPTESLLSTGSSSSSVKSSMSSPTSRQSYSMATGGGGVIVTDRIRSMTTPTGQPWSVNINPGKKSNGQFIGYTCSSDNGGGSGSGGSCINGGKW